MTTKSIVTGFHAVTALLKQSPERIQQLCVATSRNDKRMQTLLDLAREAHLSEKRQSPSEMNEYVGDDKHQGVFAVCSPLPVRTEHDLADFLEKATDPVLFLILDGVQDPHNLGACLRSAEAVGVDAVIIPKDRSASLTAVANKAASGAAEVLPLIRVTNLARTLRFLKKAGIWLYGATGEASQSLFETQFSRPMALVMGTEGQGLRSLTKKECDFLISIPMQGVVGSLNVSVATGVCLFEVLRQT